MQPVQFLSNSIQVEQIIKGLTLTRSLMVTSILIGEPYTGKKSLVESIFPKSTFIDGNDTHALLHALDTYEEIVIYHFEAIAETLSRYDFNNKRIIAITNDPLCTAAIEEKFAFIYHMPSLKERSEDIPLLTKYFCDMIREELMITSECSVDQAHLDLSENIKSLKASLYRQLVTADLSQDALEKLLYAYLYPRLEGKNAYREHLELFERPLIQAGLAKYRSQLKLSSVLGLNRNTLRKKIYEHNLD
jgi:DNA-binding protein Fis